MPRDGGGFRDGSGAQWQVRRAAAAASGRAELRTSRMPLRCGGIALHCRGTCIPARGSGDRRGTWRRDRRGWRDARRLVHPLRGRCRPPRPAPPFPPLRGPAAWVPSESTHPPPRASSSAGRIRRSRRRRSRRPSRTIRAGAAAPIRCAGLPRRAPPPRGFRPERGAGLVQCITGLDRCAGRSRVHPVPGMWA